jgi:hypothetical protein
MRTKWILIFLAAAIITGCEFKCSVGGDDKTESKEFSSSESDSPLKGASIKNDIMLDAKNVKVREVYLANEARMPLDKNEIALGEKIRCVVVLDTGWTKYGNTSYLGASEKILTDGGDVILDVEDLFKDYTESGLSASDAEVVSISANITEKQTGVDDYKVQFRIWDKRGKGEVTGSFKFKVN